MAVNNRRVCPAGIPIIFRSEGRTREDAPYEPIRMIHADRTLCEHVQQAQSYWQAQYALLPEFSMEMRGSFFTDADLAEVIRALTEQSLERDADTDWESGPDVYNSAQHESSAD